MHQNLTLKWKLSMPNYRRAKTKGATYFFTVITYRRQEILCDKLVRDTLREGIINTRKTNPFTIDAWVLLPNHLHCIWTLPSNDENFGVRWAMIKRHVTKTCASVLYRDEWMTESKRKRNESTIWQRRFWEHQIRDEQDFKNHIDYIHHNPVKHNVVDCVKEWPYSTFHRYVQKGIYSKGWAGGDIMELENKYGE